MFGTEVNFNDFSRFKSDLFRLFWPIVFYFLLFRIVSREFIWEKEPAPIVMQAMTTMKERDTLLIRSLLTTRSGNSTNLPKGRNLTRVIRKLRVVKVGSDISSKDDDGSDPELSFDDIEDDEDMIEIDQALEGLVTFDFFILNMESIVTKDTSKITNRRYRANRR